jgi:hypothetical protein
MSKYGKPVRGMLTSADASSGAAIPMYENGSLTVVTLSATQFLTITDYEIHCTPGGDTFMHVGTLAGTPAAGEYVARGDLQADGRLAGNLDCPRTYVKGSTPFLTAPAGNVSVTFSGYITEV